MSRGSKHLCEIGVIKGAINRKVRDCSCGRAELITTKLAVDLSSQRSADPRSFQSTL